MRGRETAREALVTGPTGFYRDNLGQAPLPGVPRPDHHWVTPYKYLRTSRKAESSADSKRPLAAEERAAIGSVEPTILHQDSPLLRVRSLQSLSDSQQVGPPLELGRRRIRRARIHLPSAVRLRPDSQWDAAFLLGKTPRVEQVENRVQRAGDQPALTLAQILEVETFELLHPRLQEPGTAEGIRPPTLTLSFTSPLEKRDLMGSPAARHLVITGRYKN